MSHCVIGIELPFTHNIVVAKNDETCTWRLDVLPHRYKQGEQVLLVSARLKTGEFAYVGRAIVKDDSVQLTGIRLATFWNGRGIKDTVQMLNDLRSGAREFVNISEGHAQEKKEAPVKQAPRPSLEDWLASLSNERLTGMVKAMQAEMEKRGLVEAKKARKPRATKPKAVAS